MISWILVVSLAVGTSSADAPPPPSLSSCTAESLRPFVAPTGLRAPWPEVRELPDTVTDTVGELLSDQGIVMDGYAHTLHVDTDSQLAYVVQQGGIAGFRTVYGPLPVAWCSAPPPNNSFKPNLLRKSA